MDARQGLTRRHVRGGTDCLPEDAHDRATDSAHTAIARTIEIDLKQMIGDENIPQPINPVRNFLM